MKSMLMSAVYLSEREFNTAALIEASNSIWYPGKAKPLEGAFLCYGGYSQNNMSAASSITEHALKSSKKKKAYIYEFDIESKLNEVYVHDTPALRETVDIIDLARCDKSLLEEMAEKFEAEGYKVHSSSKSDKRTSERLDKGNFFNFICENPEVIRIIKSEDLLPNVKAVRVTYSHEGKAYVLVYVLDRSIVVADSLGLTHVTIKLDKRVVLDFPMFEEDIEV
tara:strand:+ start:792 stop:1460 length:669 start_codon:yes stop_codon:yes gene_type:complete